MEIKIPIQLPDNWADKVVEKLLAKGDFVEVVRCKNCKYGRNIDKNKSPEKYFREGCIVCTRGDVVGNESMICLPTHYCSYGAKMDGDNL